MWECNSKAGNIWEASLISAAQFNYSNVQMLISLFSGWGCSSKLNQLPSCLPASLRLRDTHFRHQESTLDPLTKRHSKGPQEETVGKNCCFNLGKELVEVLFVVLNALQAVPAMQTFRKPDKWKHIKPLGISRNLFEFNLLHHHC